MTLPVLSMADLNQHFGAVAPFLDHALDRLQMADGAREAVDHGLGIFVGMGVPAMPVRVRDAGGVQRGVRFLAQRFGGEIDAFFVHAASPQATFYDAWRQNAMRERRECVKL